MNRWSGGDERSPQDRGSCDNYWHYHVQPTGGVCVVPGNPMITSYPLIYQPTLQLPLLPHPFFPSYPITLPYPCQQHSRLCCTTVEDYRRHPGCRDQGGSIRESLVFLSVCEGVVEALVEECVTQLANRVVNDCIDDLLRSYLCGTRHTSGRFSDRQLSLERATVQSAHGSKHTIPLPTEDDCSCGGYGDRLMHMYSTEEVCAWWSGQLMEESLFCQLLEDYISEGKKMAAMEITQQVLTESIFEGLLKISCTQT